MSIAEKIKAINNKIEQNKAQYNLDGQTAKISALSSGNVSKYEFLTGKDVLPKKDLLEKAVTIKRFEYSLLGKELEKQTSVTEKQYQKFDNVFEANKNEDDKTKSKKSRTKSNLVYNNYFTFYKYRNTEAFIKCPLDSKLNNLQEFKNKLELFYQDIKIYLILLNQARLICSLHQILQKIEESLIFGNNFDLTGQRW